MIFLLKKTGDFSCFMLVLGGGGRICLSACVFFSNTSTQAELKVFLFHQSTMQLVMADHLNLVHVSWWTG